MKPSANWRIASSPLKIKLYQDEKDTAKTTGKSTAHNPI